MTKLIAAGLAFVMIFALVSGANSAVTFPANSLANSPATCGLIAAVVTAFVVK